jgi:hypothetical protein
MKIERMLRRFMAPNEADGSDTGGAVDRGDGVADTTAATTTAAADDTAGTERDDKGRFAKKEDDAAGEEAGADDKGGEKADKADKPKTHMIPKARFDEAVHKERSRTEAAERRAAELEKQIQQVGHNENTQQLEADIEALEDKLESARLDGNKDKARELSKELRLKERQISVAESSRMSSAAKDQAREEIRLDLTIDKLEGLYPVLDEKADTFDQDVVDLVLATQRDLMARERMSPSKALEEAARKVTAKLMPANSDGGKPEADEDEKGGLKSAKNAADGRKGAQVKKNLDTAAKQPASMKEAGMDSDKAGQSKETPDASVMSYEEFSALPEATKAKMRGDFA